MTNTKRSGVTFAHGDETLTYRLSTNALCRYEDLMGGETVMRALTTLQDAEESEGLDIEFRRVRALFWAGLPEEIGVADAGDIIDDIGGVQEAFKIVGKGAALAFPEAKEDDAGNARKPAKKPAT